MTWILKGSFEGQDGTDGISGTVFTSGAGAPSTPGNVPGDQYLRTSTYDLYQWTGSAWTIIANIKGIPGPAGDVDLNKLQLLVAEGPFELYPNAMQEITYDVTGVFITKITWYQDATKTKKAVQEEATYNLNGTVATSVYTNYQPDGVTVLATCTETYSYSGLNPTGSQRSTV